MKIIKKADEMEMYINFKSLKHAWAFGNISLIIWAVLSCIYKSENIFILIIIIAAQNIIFFVSKIYISKKMAEDNNEK